MLTIAIITLIVQVCIIDDFITYKVVYGSTLQNIEYIMAYEEDNINRQVLNL